MLNTEHEAPRTLTEHLMDRPSGALRLSLESFDSFKQTVSENPKTAALIAAGVIAGGAGALALGAGRALWRAGENRLPSLCSELSTSSRPGVSRGLEVAVRLAPAEKVAAAEIPSMWNPQRSFSNTEELFAATGFTHGHQITLARPGVIEQLVPHVRAPMSSWSEDLSSVGKFRLSLDGRLMSGMGHNLSDPRIDAILESRVHGLDSSMNFFAQKAGLPAVPIAGERDLPGALAALRSSDGKILVPDASLMISNTDPHEFVGVVAHEYEHGAQLSLMIRQMAQIKGVTHASGAKGYQQVADYFAQLKGQEMDPALVERTLAHNSSSLNATQSSHAEALLEGWGTYQGDGGLQRIYFSQVRQHLKDLHGLDGANPEFMAEGLLRCANSSGFAEINFGSSRLTPRLTQLRRDIIDNNQAWKLPSAVEELKPVLKNRLVTMNADLQADYDKYMRLHEREALVVGNLARLHSEQFGAISGH